MSEKKITSRDLAQTQTREALFKAAERMVAERGFAGASIGEIVKAAGYTKGAFYSNFESKDTMLLELVERLKLEQKKVLSQLESLSTYDLSAALDGMASFFANHAIDPIASLLVGELQLQARRDGVVAEAAKVSLDAHIELMASWLDSAATAAQKPLAMPPRHVVRAILALSQGLAQQPANRGEIAEIARGVLRQIFGL